MEYVLRPATVEEFDALTRTQAIAFGFDQRPGAAEARAEMLEPERSLAAFDGEAMVSSAGAYRFDMTVPGATLACAGVTMVSVLPTHRRRGILSAMMKHQLESAREWSEPIAALWASESGIYGRFGYGLASENVSWTLERTHAVLRDDIQPTGRVRLLRAGEASELIPAVYELSRAESVGFITRAEPWWRLRHFEDPAHRREGATEKAWAVYEEAGQVVGYVSYRRKLDFADHWIPSGAVYVLEMLAPTPSAQHALWNFLFGIDLNAGIEATERPRDEPLYWLLRDPRRLRRRPNDSLLLRLVDVPTALAARRYAVEGEVVLEISDGFCPWNSGRYQLSGGPGGATCSPTNKAPQVTLTAEALGAAYLGDTGLAVLAGAGRVSGDPGALKKADLMFSWRTPAWCPEIF